MPARDVNIHAAVTILDSYRGKKIVGLKDHEVCQLAVEFAGPHVPVTETHVRTAFKSLCEETIKRMREAGLIRA